MYYDLRPTRWYTPTVASGLRPCRWEGWASLSPGSGRVWVVIDLFGGE